MILQLKHVIGTGCTHPRHLVIQAAKFCMVACNILSIIIAVNLPVHIKLCIFSLALGTRVQVTLRFTGQFLSVELATYPSGT